jgi:hypothetical protein
MEKENIVCPGCDEQYEELVQNTGCSESNAKVDGRSSILRLKEIWLLRAQLLSAYLGVPRLLACHLFPPPPVIFLG